MTGLTRAAIVERAHELAAAEGLAAISLRRLAREFDVSAMALYWHVENKEGLLNAMAERCYEGVAVPADGTWPERLRGVLAALVGELRRYPATAHLAPYRALHCPAGLALCEDL